MRRRTALLLLLPGLLACELDFTGLGDSWGGTWGGSGYDVSPPAATLVVVGDIFSGDVPVVDGEGIVEVFTSPEASAPALELQTRLGGYRLDFGNEPDPSVCGYEARVVRWDGATTDRQRLFADGVSCAPTFNTGPDFALPAYEPLDEPLRLTGAVWVENQLAVDGTQVRLDVRPTSLSDPWTQVALEVRSGAYAFETDSRAEWFYQCSRAHVEAQTASGFTSASLFEAPLDRCGPDRVLPDIRAGWEVAVEGRVQVGTELESRSAEAGEAHVTLLTVPASAIVAEAETLDDGSFHLWFPYGTSDPGCDYRIRIEHRAGAVQEVDLVPARERCATRSRWREIRIEAT